MFIYCIRYLLKFIIKSSIDLHEENKITMPTMIYLDKISKSDKSDRKKETNAIITKKKELFSPD